MARTINRSVGRGGVNQRPDVITVQELLNGHVAKLGLRALVADGQVGQLTIGAIESFQRKVVGLSQPDGRVDPGGKTLAALNQGGAAPAPIVVGTVRVTFEHGGTTPPSSLSGGHTTNDLYESKVTVTGAGGGTFRGSIFPDDMSVKGRINDGTYDLYLGFHKRQSGAFQPSATDLVVRTNGSRTCLVVNLDNPVPVTSNNPAKTTSSAIHVHNGYNGERGSDGCQTIHPEDWSRFIKLFMDAYPTLAQWQATNKYVGVKVGVLEVKA